MSEPLATQTPHDLESDVREQALERVKKRRDLSTHAFTYLVVNGAVWGVWALTGQGDLWPLWLTGLWAIGLVLNVWDVYGRRPITEADVRREMDRLRVREDGRQPRQSGR